MAMILDTSNHVIPISNIFGKKEKKVLELLHAWRFLVNKKSKQIAMIQY